MREPQGAYKKLLAF